MNGLFLATVFVLGVFLTMLGLVMWSRGSDWRILAGIFWLVAFYEFWSFLKSIFTI